MAIYRISRDIEERAYGNKREIEFPGVMKKKSCEISMGLVWFSILEFPRGVVKVRREVYLHPLLLGYFLE